MPSFCRLLLSTFRFSFSFIVLLLLNVVAYYFVRVRTRNPCWCLRVFIGYALSWRVSVSSVFPLRFPPTDLFVFSHFVGGLLGVG